MKNNFNGTKVRVNNPEESRLLQEEAFKNNCTWNSSNSPRTVQHVHAKFYFFSGYITIDSDENPSYFNNHSNREVKFSDIISPINIDDEILLIM